jgi:hypothetical protein
MSQILNTPLILLPRYVALLPKRSIRLTAGSGIGNKYVHGDSFVVVDVVVLKDVRCYRVNAADVEDIHIPCDWVEPIEVCPWLTECAQAV